MEKQEDCRVINHLTTKPMKVIIGIILVLGLSILFVVTVVNRPDDEMILELDDEEKKKVEADLERAREQLLEREEKDINLDGQEE